MNPITAPGFNKWLNAIPDSEIVGTSQTVTYCPLASYAREANGGYGTVAYVQVDGYRIVRACENTLWGDFRCNDWRALFVQGIDRIGRHIDITAADARAVLCRVTNGKYGRAT